MSQGPGVRANLQTGPAGKSQNYEHGALAAEQFTTLVQLGKQLVDGITAITRMATMATTIMENGASRQKWGVAVLFDRTKRRQGWDDETEAGLVRVPPHQMMTVLTTMARTKPPWGVMNESSDERNNDNLKKRKGGDTGNAGKPRRSPV
jgi:hypothetical protein